MMIGPRGSWCTICMCVIVLLLLGCLLLVPWWSASGHAAERTIRTAMYYVGLSSWFLIVVAADHEGG